MIVMRWSPADVLHPIATLELVRSPFPASHRTIGANTPPCGNPKQPFRDAGYARADFHLSLQSTIYGIHRAISLRLLDLSAFDLAAYETYEKVCSSLPSPPHGTPGS